MKTSLPLPEKLAKPKGRYRNEKKLDKDRTTDKNGVEEQPIRLRLRAGSARDADLVLYIDGVMQDWDDLSGETRDISNSNSFYIGTKTDSEGLFNGTIDEVKVC